MASLIESLPASNPLSDAPILLLHSNNTRCDQVLTQKATCNFIASTLISVGSESAMASTKNVTDQRKLFISACRLEYAQASVFRHMDHNCLRSGAAEIHCAEREINTYILFQRGQGNSAKALFHIKQRIWQIGAGVIGRVHPIDGRGEREISFIIDGIWSVRSTVPGSIAGIRHAAASRSPAVLPNPCGRYWH